MSITVYSKPNCTQCDATYRALDRKGFEYSTVDISKDQVAFERIAAAGALSAPYVEVTDEAGVVSSWSGFRPENIRALAL